MQQSSRPMQLSTLDVTAQIRCDVAQFNSVFEPWTQEIQKELTRAESNHKQTIQQQKGQSPVEKILALALALVLPVESFKCSRTTAAALSINTAAVLCWEGLQTEA